MKRTRKPSRHRAGVIPLNDLSPKRNPSGGSGGPAKIVFGERPIPDSADVGKAGDGRATAVEQRREKERK